MATPYMDLSTPHGMSSYSNNGGACVEVATNLPDLVAIRRTRRIRPGPRSCSVPVAGSIRALKD